MNTQRFSFLFFPLLLACAGQMPHDRSSATPARPEARTPREALARTLAAIDELGGEDGAIRLRGAESRLQESSAEGDATCLVRLDLDFLASDALEATQLQDRLVHALQDDGALGPVGASSSKVLDSGRGIACDSFVVEFRAPHPGHEPADGTGGESRIRTTAVQSSLHIGQVDISKRASRTSAGSWVDYQIRPANRRSVFQLSAVMGFAEALEKGPEALSVTEIQLRPSEHVQPGGDAARSWTFEVEARQPEA